MKTNKKISSIGIIGMVCGFLGALGGAKNTSKGYRRYGIVGVLIITSIILKNYWALLLGAWIGILSMGYGIPDKEYLDNPDVDSGSSLGRFWFNRFSNKEKDRQLCLTSIFVSLTIGFYYSIVILLIALLNNELHLCLVTVPLAFLSHFIFGHIIKGMGNLELFKVELSWIEVCRFLTLGLAGAIQVIGG